MTPAHSVSKTGMQSLADIARVNLGELPDEHCLARLSGGCIEVSC